MKLSRPDLFRQAAYLAGTWVPAGTDGIDVLNPSTGARLGAVPKITASQTGQAIEQAQTAFHTFKRLTGKQRSAMLRRWYELMLQHAQDLATIMTAEQGKPLSEARAEIDYAAAYLEWFAEEAKRVYGDTILAPKASQRISVTKEAVGVCAAITPWNFPSAMVTRKIGPALAAGCTVVLKPAQQTPFSALALCVLAEEAGFPAGTISVLTGESASIGGELLANPSVRKLSFTGSTPVGKTLMAAAAGTVKKLSLELGGNAPFIVFEDADLDAAVAGAMLSKFRNAGQTCVCANRFLVHRDIHDAFVAKLAHAVAGMKMGDGFDPASQLGPLIDAKAIEKVSRLVDDAREAGAIVLQGGRHHQAGKHFYAPTVLTEVTSHMEISREEIFGPVVAVQRFSNEAEAVEIANATPYGLAAYFYTRDLNRTIRVSEALDFGIVGVNEGAVSTEVAPFGGVKESGFGKEGSKYGLEEYLEKKYVCVGNVA
ncbi:NAD-dependent succinate-semialdehyde dehydrogenase [Cupriavidus taiwanensis]|uniref:NAD-dependent succinate-semialdehyde dehydrogenase n=1 Tax=Cupriavidus taiwanensis TaxID=164546 RepID=UPI0025415CC3|nr:NAD-dependent succinate-semialdehyde dehydrogenase [Cupriavidus taiwanensis]MDK3022652.1 NAD-dependent succinate-semialdehyde dehydrogenase [Cupriavidus taiwanensis]